MSKMTPGPWSLAKTSTGFPCVRGPEYDVATPSFCGVNYGKLKESPNKVEEILANATAIAALPDLIEAAKNVERFYITAFPMRTADVHPERCECLRCAVDAISAALRKAGVS